MRTLSLFAVLVGLAATATPAIAQEEPAPAAALTLLEVHETFYGQIHLPMSVNGEPGAPEPRLIRDAEAFADFVDLIPERVVAPIPDPPASSDPLLQDPEIDWDRHMLLVAVRGENMHVRCHIELVCVADGAIVAHIRHDEIGDTGMMQSALGVGTYCAVLVDRADGELEYSINPGDDLDLPDLGDLEDIELPVFERWEGRIHLALGANASDRVAPEPAIIRSQEAYEAFVDRIPTHEITRSADPAESNDPLLDLPEIDFEICMLIVVCRDENMYIRADITGVRTNIDGDVIAAVHYPGVGDTAMMASRMDIGTYTAVLVPSIEGELVIERVDAPTGATGELEIGEEYRGRIHLPASQPGEYEAPDPVIIRDADEYRAFVERIPTREISPDANAGNSNDPLLAGSPIDFDTHMLIVWFRGVDMYASGTIESVTANEEGVHVAVAPDALGASQMMASQAGIGTYVAVVVPRAEGPLHVELLRPAVRDE